MRSLLFVPGDSPKKFAKALGTAADALILDLEDSVALTAKTGARGTVREMLEGDRAGKRLFVRVNAFDTGDTLADLAAVMPARPDAIMLPKAGGGADMVRLGHHLDAFETAFGIEPGATGILPIVTETATAVMQLASYTPAHPRLIGLMWGAEDLIASLGAAGNKAEGAYTAPFTMARNHCLFAAASAGVTPVDTICTDLKNLDTVAEEARAARRDGFAAKAVIHPAHIDPVNAAFTPSPEEIAWAERVVAAFEEYPGAGVVAIDGKMVDKPHERAARQVLAQRPEG